MEDIHDPSVGRYRSDVLQPSLSGSSRLVELRQQRRALEDELDALISVLESVCTV